MDGVHDMGGMDGFGPLSIEKDEPIFHARWEARIFAIYRSLGFLGFWSIDEQRHSQEQLPPDVYLASSYYRRWTLNAERLIAKHGLATTDELASGKLSKAPLPVKRVLTKDMVTNGVRRANFSREPRGKPVFNVGDRVKAKKIDPGGATRLPRYARGHNGRIERIQGCHVFPDSVVARKNEDPQWLYTVAFDATELWGHDADPSLKVSIEAFEPYLEPITSATTA